MNLHEVIVERMLKPDGTLELNQRPKVRPGSVQVVLQQESEPTPLPEDWRQFLLRARRQLEDEGSSFMSEEGVNAHVQWLREGDRVDELLKDPGC